MPIGSLWKHETYQFRYFQMRPYFKMNNANTNKKPSLFLQSFLKLPIAITSVWIVRCFCKYVSEIRKYVKLTMFKGIVHEFSSYSLYTWNLILKVLNCSYLDPSPSETDNQLKRAGRVVHGLTIDMLLARQREHVPQS